MDTDSPGHEYHHGWRDVSGSSCGGWSSFCIPDRGWRWFNFCPREGRKGETEERPWTTTKQRPRMGWEYFVSCFVPFSLLFPLARCTYIWCDACPEFPAQNSEFTDGMPDRSRACEKKACTARLETHPRTFWSIFWWRGGGCHWTGTNAQRLKWQELPDKIQAVGPQKQQSGLAQPNFKKKHALQTVEVKTTWELMGVEINRKGD